MIYFLCFLVGLALGEVMHYRIRHAEKGAFLRGRAAQCRAMDAHVNTPVHADDLVLLTPDEALQLQHDGYFKKVKKAG